MKVKFLPMFAGVIATAAFAATSLPAFAQAPPAPAPAPAQNRPRIVFTQEQQSKFESIKNQTVGDIEAVLSADQKQQFAAGRENGEGLGAV